MMPAAHPSAESRGRGQRPLRALHIYSGNLFGGIERTFLMYAEYARPDLWEPEYALCFDGELRKQLARLGARLHDLGPVRTRHPWTVARARERLRDILSANHYDVVITHSAWGQSLAYPVAKEAGIGNAFHLHDVANGTHWVERLAQRCPPTLLICNSHFTARSSKKLYQAVPRAVVYSPVLLSAHQPGSPTRKALRSLLNTSTEDIVIFSASRMQPLKGHLVLIQALASLRTNRAWTCWIAGGSQRPEEVTYEAEVRRMAVRSGIASRVRFLGQRHDIPRLLEAADIYCQPNTAPETFGISFVEALNAGLPVITSSIGGAREIVNQGCGILTDLSAGSVTKALCLLVEDDAMRARLGANGVARARMLCEPVRQTESIVHAFSCARLDAVEERRRLASSEPLGHGIVQDRVTELLRGAAHSHSRVIDVGGGDGGMALRLQGWYGDYVACDEVAAASFPYSGSTRFVATDLGGARLPFDDASADIVMAVEAIAYRENPRAFVRELVRIARPGARIIMTTSNQLSILSKLTFVLRNQFHAFQEAPGLYPRHITPLPELDFVRILRECGLEGISVEYSNRGRIPLTAQHWPASLGFRGRAFSETVIVTALKPVNPSTSRQAVPS